MPSHRVLPVVVGLAVAGAAAVSLAQYGSADAKDASTSPAPQAAAPQAAASNEDMGNTLIKGLKETPGCLGVDAGGMMSGKQVIFAFFKDKAAAMAWYESPVHKKFRRMMPVGENDREPMEHVPDGVPVMAVASITFGDKPAIENSPIPFSQIAIELYTPLTGGLEIGGSFAPAEFLAPVRKPG